LNSENPSLINPALQAPCFDQACPEPAEGLSTSASAIGAPCFFASSQPVFPYEKALEKAA